VATTLGDAELAELRTRYGGPLIRLAMRLTDGDKGHAEDLLQETLIRAWQHPEALDGQPALPWLFTVCRRLAIDAYRRRTHRPAEVSHETLTHDPPSDDDPDRLLDAQIIAKAVARLSTNHRAVIIELYYRDRSVAETAVMLGIPQGTVKSRAYYALKMLRLALDVPATDTLSPALTRAAAVRGRGFHR
jgi:RNA polymerase sigma-70 factor, ECF subfamily